MDDGTRKEHLSRNDTIFASSVGRPNRLRVYPCKEVTMIGTVGPH